MDRKLAARVILGSLHFEWWLARASRQFHCTDMGVPGLTFETWESKNPIRVSPTIRSAYLNTSFSITPK